jgi:C4-dicarboxylate transporter, DctQ subunit
MSAAPVERALLGALPRASRIWDRIEQTLVGLLGLCALVIGVWQVVGRYFAPADAISYAEEVIVYLIVWGIMLVSSQLVRTDGHVRPDLVLRIIPPGVQRWVEVFNCILAISFCAGLVYYGWQIVDTSLIIDEHSSTDLQFPMWIYYLALPVGAALMTLRYVIRLFQYLLFYDPSRASIGQGAHEATMETTLRQAKIVAGK